MQAGNITTNLNVKVDFALPALSATIVMMWKYRGDNFSKGSCDMILGQDSLT